MERYRWLMYAIGFVSSLHFFGGVLVPFFTEWGNLPLSVIPQIQLWFMVWSAVLELPTGVIADKYGAKVSVISGFMVAALGISVYVVRPVIGFFLLGELLVALGFALVSGADVSLLLSSVSVSGNIEEDRYVKTHARNKYQIARRVGTLLGGFSGSILAVAVGYQWVYWLSGLMFGAAALLCMFLPSRETAELINHRSIREVVTSAFRVVQFQPSIKRIAFDFSTISALTGTVIWFNQMILQEVGFPLIWFGMVGSLGMVFEMVYSLTSAPLQRCLGSKYVTISAYMPIIGMVTVLVALLAKSWLLAVVGIVIWFTIIDGWISLMDVAVDELVPRSEFNTIRSTVFSLRKLMIGGSYIVMSAALGHSVFLAISIVGGILLLYILFAFRSRLK